MTSTLYIDQRWGGGSKGEGDFQDFAMGAGAKCMLDCLRCAVGSLHSQKLLNFSNQLPALQWDLGDFMERKIGKEKDSA